jgi:type IV secretion system protein VirB2
MDPSSIACNVVKQLTGAISQAIATLVIIITGYSFFIGKVSIGMLFIVAAGVMFVFGAPTILNWAIGANAQLCKTQCTPPQTLQTNGSCA